jgi:hypothetical protein
MARQRVNADRADAIPTREGVVMHDEKPTGRRNAGQPAQWEAEAHSDEINHLAESANFLAAYEAEDKQALWQAIVYCAGHHIPLWEWLAAELLMPWQRAAPGSLDDWHSNPAMPTGEE